MTAWTRRRLLLTSAATALPAAGLATAAATPARAAAATARPGNADVADALRGLPGEDTLVRWAGQEPR
ncbi:hypothetical protein ACFY64_02715 [Streptomyces collinus]|uniref:hypothetical protein n=1 Tax=Streptomyces collinus TaxID=42684 RepID=UPI0036828B7D